MQCWIEFIKKESRVIIASAIAFLNLISAVVIFINKGDINVAYFNLVAAVVIATWVYFGMGENSEIINIDYCECRKPTYGYKDGDYWVCSICNKIVEPPDSDVVN